MYNTKNAWRRKNDFPKWTGEHILLLSLGLEG